MKDKVPVSLKVVAGLFIISGCFKLIEMITALSQRELNLDFGILNLFIGIGLLKLRAAWRIIALIVIGITLLTIPIGLSIMMFSDAQARFAWFGQEMGYMSKYYILGIGLIIYAFIIWEYRVLNRPDVKALFI